MSHKHKWRAYGQPDDTIVCDGCNVAIGVSEIAAESFAGGVNFTKKKIAQKIKNLDPEKNNYDFLDLLIDSEKDIWKNGYLCAKNDIEEGLK